MAFEIRKYAKAGETLDLERIVVPEAPGASWSPQIPGEVPDRSDIPGESQMPVPPDPTPGVRDLPRTELGTSQHIMHVFAPDGDNADDPSRFEQAPVSYEEVRKANPALRTPLRPAPGYALTAGTRLPSPELAALDDTTGTSEPAPGE